MESALFRALSFKTDLKKLYENLKTLMKKGLLKFQ